MRQRRDRMEISIESKHVSIVGIWTINLMAHRQKWISCIMEDINNSNFFNNFDILRHALLLPQNKRTQTLEIFFDIMQTVKSNSMNIYAGNAGGEKNQNENNTQCFGRISAFPFQCWTDGGRHGNDPRGNGLRLPTTFPRTLSLVFTAPVSPQFVSFIPYSALHFWPLCRQQSKRK